MATTNFQRPAEIIANQNKFGTREVGINHPDNNSFVKVASNGDLYIMGGPDLGIIISPAKGAIFLMADTVKFLTKEDEGLRWNKLAFNSKAVTYSEPAFIYPKTQEKGLYDGIGDFID